MTGVTSSSIPCIYMVKLPEEGRKGQMMRFKGPAGEELSTDGALSTFVADVLAGKIAPHRWSLLKMFISTAIFFTICTHGSHA
jgi:hypothetical protein